MDLALRVVSRVLAKGCLTEILNDGIDFKLLSSFDIRSLEQKALKRTLE
jgi:hypothetical protein